MDTWRSGSSRIFGVSSGTVELAAISGLGGLYVAAAIARGLVRLSKGEPFIAAAISFVLIASPGVALLYGGYRLPQTDIHPSTYSRIVGWCLGGTAAVVAVVTLRILDPGEIVEEPLWSAVLAMGIGSIAGLAMGATEAQAITRAREAEQHKRELQRQNTRLESFGKILAHELRNPLAIAQMYLPTAADGDEDAVDEVKRAHERMEEMITILLRTARTTDTTIEGEPVALADIATTT